MNKVFWIFIIVTVLLSSCKSAIKKYHLIVIQFSDQVPAYNQTYKGFIDGLIDKGYNIKTNLTIEYYCMITDKNNHNLIPIKRIIDTKKDLILTLGTIPTKLILNVVPVPNPTPLVFSVVLEPKALELNKDKRKKLNVTGLSMKLPIRKQFYTLKEALPYIKKLGLFYSFDYPQSLYFAKEMKEIATKEFNLETYETTFPVTLPLDKIEELCKKLAEKVDVIYLIDPLTHTSVVLERIIKAADEAKIPVVGISDPCLRYGALLKFYCDFYELGYRTSYVVDKILKGIPPYSIPIQYPKDFNIGVNLTKAQKLGIHISRNFLLKTDSIVY